MTDIIITTALLTLSWCLMARSVPKARPPLPKRRKHRMGRSHYDELLSYRGRAYRVHVLEADRVKQRGVN